MRNPPALPHLDLPKVSVTSDETALFQHDPSADSKVRQEWEPGCQPDEVYDAALPAWRAGARRYLVNRLRKEKEWMSTWQSKVRTERRDRYFYWTAIFGTHTFFNAFLPLFFWYGDPAKGRGLLNAVGLGIYMSSFSKDLVCTPRPYSPPVVRLAMSTHAHEYGFPSSHSTNTLTIALFMAQWVWETRQALGWIGTTVANTILLIYVFSVVGGRVYTGMHSIADIVGGSSMGILCWALGLISEGPLETWTMTGSLTVPLMLVPITGACVHYHPAPVDPCPCFEDAIAVLSVMLGGVLAHWVDLRTGSAAPALSTEIWASGPIIGSAIVLERLVVGITIVFGWRIIAKRTLLRLLPTIFRSSSRLLDFDLPTRKGYTAATDYKGFPTTPIRSLPSFLDLGQADATPDDTPTDSPVNGPSPNDGATSSSAPLLDPGSALRQRSSVKASGKSERSRGLSITEGRAPQQRPTETKFDVEVLTKVIVYFGIGVLACVFIPYIHSWIEDRLF